MKITTETALIQTLTPPPPPNEILETEGVYRMGNKTEEREIEGVESETEGMDSDNEGVENKVLPIVRK